VPCALTPRQDFDFMGYSLRTSSGWRFSAFCKWNGTSLSGDFSDHCPHRELYDLRADVQRVHEVLRRDEPSTSLGQLFNPDDPAFSINLAGNQSFEAIEAALFAQLVSLFERG